MTPKVNPEDAASSLERAWAKTYEEWLAPEDEKDRALDSWMRAATVPTTEAATNATSEREAENTEGEP